MNRWGYLVTIALVVGLGLYAFWPSALSGDSVRVWVGPRPDDFTVLDPRWPQQVHGQTVTVGGHERGIDGMAMGHLWLMLDALAAPKSKVRDDVGPDQLAAYGIDGKHGIDAQGFHLRWGTVGADGYCAVGSRVLSFSAAAIAQLAEVASRLDARTAFPLADSANRLSVDGTDYERVPGRWIDQLHPNRPGLSIHISELLSLISHVAIDSLDGAGAGGEPIHRIEFSQAGSAQSHAVVLRQDPRTKACTLQADDLPAQALSFADQAQWLGLIDELKRDFLLELDGRVARAQVKGLDFQRGGQDWFSLQRRDLAYRVGETSWQLSWADGREKASELAVAQVLSSLCDLAVAHAETGPDPLPTTALMVQVRLTLQDNSMMLIAFDGDRAWTPQDHGVISGRTPLQTLEPASLLDLAVLDAAPERIVKIQRIGTDPPLKEVLSRHEDGVWVRSYGDGPCDPVAIGRIARALTETQAIDARFTTAEDRARIAHCPIEVDVRLEPRAQGAPRMEIADEQDTVTQNCGFAGIQDERGRWWLVDLEGGVSYQVDRDLIDLLRTPIHSDTILPLVPSLVRQLIFQHGARADTLTREGERWWYQQGAGAREAADPTQVRRYLRTLAGLVAAKRDPDAPLLLPATAAISVSVVMPASPGEERLTLSIQEPAGDLADASVTSSVHGVAVPRGRVSIDRASTEDLMAESRERFALGAPAHP